MNTPLKRIKKAIWTRSWTPDQIHRYIGGYQRCYFTYANDTAIRDRAASGGSISALIVHLLESGQIAGALLLRTAIREGKVRPEFFIATTPQEVLSAQGSTYSAVYFADDALPLLRAFEGRVAVVALPCDATILARTRAKDPALDAKIACVITLFCGHNSEPELTDAIVRRLGKGHGELVDFRYRFGHWRGSLQATYADGTAVVRPFETFSDYRNLYFFAQPKCHHCHDHFGYDCDISAGDIWSPRMKAHPIKHTALITRTAAGQALVADALAAGVLSGSEEPIAEVLDGQARTAPFHYNVTARARVGRLFRLKIKDRVQDRVRPVDYLIAFLALLNERVSRTRWGRRLVLALPRPVLRAYLLFMKALESI